MPKRERILCFDFIRTVCAFYIMLYHFCVSLNPAAHSGFIGHLENPQVALATVISAKSLHVITDRLLKTKLYIKLENRILSTQKQK